ncbi:SMP-30/gluconolactonase/LRE family protein [Chitinophaga sp. 22321]|uniref:SMP-30/gluconolactonase/LRE family protein n=1 Tax=Chitinophaga hostae TaxID=2831022 RepID=A0ABS5IX77_9BACT|nr:SMP-30/gluconolactonase/LRE family protein [Chitinophaga hostae]MBS0026957.1 SMP-30/gluconolactonase/LRE family protein [Chitinophaga hostae]
MKEYQSVLLSSLTCELAEGACWWPERNSWCWVDILGHTIYVRAENGGQQVFDVGTHVTTLVPVAERGELIAGLKSGVAFFSPERGVGPLLAVLDERENMRCNDGKCDPAGRLWIGTMQMPAEEGTGTLFCIAGKEAPVVKLRGVTISNGLVWKGDRMYYNDTHTGTIQAFNYDGVTGNIVFSRVAVHIPPELGCPDGMAIDSEGMLWVAHWGGSGVYCWNPETGVLLAKVMVPAPHVSSCAFGGVNMDEMLITTAREHMTAAEIAQYPLSGSVFHVKLPVKGLPANYFKY